MCRLVREFGIFIIRHKIEHNRIHAEALVGGCRAIVEDVTEVRIATGTEHFYAPHTVSIVWHIGDTIRANGFVEAGPAATAGKFCIGLEERIAAYCTEVTALGFGTPVLACEGPFGAFFTGYFVHIRWEYFAPLFVCYG